MRSLSVLLAGALIGVVGCGSQQTSTGLSSDDYQTLRFASGMYETYLNEHRGKAPPDEQSYRTFVESKQDVLERMQRTADQLLSSPRTGEPLTFVYGKNPPKAPIGGSYVAYEKAPVDGKRIVIGGRGGYEEMDEAQFKKVFPGAI